MGGIREGRDFFKYTGSSVDWIITNPPYSTFDQFLTKALACAENVLVVVPVPKLMASYKKLDQVYRWGSIKEMRYYGSGRSIGFPFGFPVAAIWLAKGEKDKSMKISFAKRGKNHG